MTDIYPSRQAATPQLLPRLDPVVHSEWTADAPITREQAAGFDRDGYLVLDDIFSDAEVAHLQAAAGKLLADPAALAPETIIAEPQSKEVRSIFELHRQSDVMARLAADARLAEVARFLLGDEVYLHQRSEEHTSELQSLMRISYAVFCLKKKTHIQQVER